MYYIRYIYNFFIEYLNSMNKLNHFSSSQCLSRSRIKLHESSIFVIFDVKIILLNYMKICFQCFIYKFNSLLLIYTNILKFKIYRFLQHLLRLKKCIKVVKLFQMLSKDVKTSS